MGKLEGTTYRYSGEELLHEIHKDAISAKWATLSLARRVDRLAMLGWANLLLLAILLFR